MNAWKLEPAKDLQLSESERWSSLRRESGLVSSFLHLAAWGLVRAGAALWHRLRVNGAEQIPAEPPFILVANHCSHLDALILGSALPWRLRDRVFPVAAGDVFFDCSWKSAFSAKFLNALPIWRKKCGPHALLDLRHRLVNEPCAYILFPEGGRSRDGQLMPFKTGIGMLVAGTDVPVVPCHIGGALGALPPGSWLPRPRRIELRVGSPLRFAHVANERQGWMQVAATLQTHVADLSRHDGSQGRADTEAAQEAGQA